MISSQEPLKDSVKDLECLRHTLLNGTTAISTALYTIKLRCQYMRKAVKMYGKNAPPIHQSLKTIELRLQYMSKALKVFEEILKDNNDSLDKRGCFRTPKPPNP